MQMVDLRQLSSWQLDPLLVEEAQQWRDELRWDYRASTELIKKFIDARSLTGSAILENGRPVGYAFYVLEDHKGLVGGLFVSPRFSQQELSQRLLTDTLTTLSGIPKLERVCRVPLTAWSVNSATILQPARSACSRRARS